MAISTPALGQPARAIDEPQLRLGGLAALAESSWMGSVQATEVLETVRPMPAARGWAVRFPRPARLPLAGLLTREFSATEASLILMVSFFLSAADSARCARCCSTPSLASAPEPAPTTRPFACPTRCSA